MSMSTRVIGFKPPDKKWNEMKAIWDACEEAEIEVPDAVLDFFDGAEPDSSGVAVELPVTEWIDADCGGSGYGYELKTSDIPEHVSVIRFYNSW